MPRPTVAPLVLSLGLALLAAGVAFGLAFLVVGALILVTGLGIWVAELLPGRGHVHEPLVEPARRPKPVTGRAGEGRATAAWHARLPRAAAGSSSIPSRPGSRAASSAVW